MADDDFDGESGDEINARLGAMERAWGTGRSAQFMAPSKPSDEVYVRNWGRFERQSCSPSGAVALARARRFGSRSSVQS